MKRAARLHSLSATDEGRVPERLVRDLFVAVQLTEPRSPARIRLDHALGPALAERLVGALAQRRRRAA